MAIKPLSTNERLGDAATHFFKTGNVLRRPDDRLQELHALLPKNGENNTRVEYDLWYDMNDHRAVHGYVYTDMMSKFIYLRVGDAKRTHAIMEEAAKHEITPVGESILADLAANNQDKYKLRAAKEFPSFVIFLAGANILNEAVDWDSIAHHVKHNGAKLKCHPLTSRDLYQLLCQRYGKENLIDKKISGHELLNNATTVGCAENSEMGLVGIAKGKKFVSVGGRNPQLTYAAIYKAVRGDNAREKLTRILSCTHSGIVPACVDNPEEYVKNFFDYYRGMPHVPPKNSNP